MDAGKSQAKGSGRDVLAVFAMVALIAGVLIAVEQFSVADLSVIMSDPIESAGLPEYTGSVSNFGVILLWTSAVAAAVAAGYGQFARPARRRFVISLAIVVGVLALDDLFMAHEWLGHALAELFRADDIGSARQRLETIVFAAYVLAGAVWAWVMRREIWRSPWPLFVLGVAGFGLSVALDLLPSMVDESVAWVHGSAVRFLEELAKLLGIGGLALYAARTSLPHLRTAARAGEPIPMSEI